MPGAFTVGVIPTRPVLLALPGARLRRALAVTVTLSLGALATACSSDDTSDAAATTTVTDGASTAATEATDDADAATASDATDSTDASDAADSSDSTAAPVADGDFYDGSVHSIDVTFDQADFDAAIATYQDTGEKAWIEVTVTIDGTEYAEAGMRLKGNSSLMSLSGGPGGAGGPGGGGVPGGAGGAGGFPGGLPFDCAADAETTPGSVTGSVTPVDPTTATAPAAPTATTDGTDGTGDVDGVSTTSEAQDLPWLIRLDKFVDDQHHQGRTDFVVRSNNTETALNEAVALAALAEAGLATQQSAPVRFTANGSEAVLRLVIEHPDDEWADATFGDGASSEGVLFQADAQGDYSYRGDDPTAYADAWDHEAGEEDYTPLIEFLDFVNNSTDEEFAAGLARPPRRRVVRPLPRDRGAVRQLRRHRRSGQQLLPVLRRRRHGDGRRLGPQPRPHRRVRARRRRWSRWPAAAVAVRPAASSCPRAVSSRRDSNPVSCPPVVRRPVVLRRATRRRVCPWPVDPVDPVDPVAGSAAGTTRS